MTVSRSIDKISTYVHEGVVGAVRDKSTCWPLVWLVLINETHVRLFAVHEYISLSYHTDLEYSGIAMHTCFFYAKIIYVLEVSGIKF